MSREYIRHIILTATIETNETTYYFDYDEYDGIITGLQGLVDFLNNIFDTELLLCDGLGECRRYAPRPISIIDEAKWPQIDLCLDWCGEFELKEYEEEHLATQEELEELEAWRDWKETRTRPAAIQ